MPASEPTAEIDERFSSGGATPRPWAEVLGVIERAEIFWLSTVRRDGRPHVTPLPAMWLDEALHFCTGPGEQKAKNLEVNPQLSWAFDAVDGGFRERSSGIAGEEFDAKGTAHVFAVTPTKVLAFAKGEPFSQTRYRFDDRR